MTLIRFRASAMGRSRFALSPLAETSSTLIALERDTPSPWHRHHGPNRDEYLRWRDRDPVRRGLLALAASTKWFPGLLGVVPPGGMGTRLHAELEQVRGWTDVQVRADLERSLTASWTTHETSWTGATDLAASAATTLQEGWARFVEPDWRRRLLILERDIMRRAGLLAAYGWREATEGMTRASDWAEDDAMTFSHQTFDDLLVGEEGLIFVPHTASNGSWTCDEPPRYALVYPAWGAAIPAPRQAAAPELLLGPGTAAVLRALETPATPSQLADVLDVSLGTISGHLKKLRRAGIIEGARLGRTVLYSQTQRGSSVMQALEE